MPFPSSFEIGTYFNTCSINGALDDLLELQEANSPHQLEYNKTCSELIDLMKKVAASCSIEKIIESLHILKQVATQVDARCVDAVKDLAGNNSIQYGSIYGFCYLYTQDTELMLAPGQILALRDLFLIKAREASGFDKALHALKEYGGFKIAVIEKMCDILTEKSRHKASSTWSSDEQLDEEFEVSVNGNCVTFTHVCQFFPVFDLAAMQLGTCRHSKIRIDEISQILAPQDFAPHHVIGDQTDDIIKEVLAMFFQRATASMPAAAFPPPPPPVTWS